MSTQVSRLQIRENITLLHCITAHAKNLYSIAFSLLLVFNFYHVEAQLTCPPEIIVNYTGDATNSCTAFATVLFDDSQVLSVCPDDPLVTNNSAFDATPLPGADIDASGNYPLGSTLVTFTNQCDGMTCSVMVTVVDMENPVCIAKNINVQLDQSGMATIVPADVDDGSYDECSKPVTMEVSPAVFDCSNIGPNVVTLMVEDGAGNISTCSATVNVSDVFGPLCNLNDITVQLDATGNASITYADLDAGVIDNCGIASNSVNPTTFDCSNIGSNLVSVNIMDINGVVSNCVVNVTVQDNVLPTIACPAPMLVSCMSDISDLSTFGTAVVGDNCSATIQETVTNNLVNGCGTIEREFIAVDASGNQSAPCVQTIMVFTDPPFALAIPTIQDIACDEELPEFDEVTFVDDCTPNMDVNIVTAISPYVVDVCNGYQIEYTWTAADGCAANTTISSTFNVMPDAEAPSIECLQDITLYSGSNDCGKHHTYVPPVVASDCSTYVITNNLDASNNFEYFLPVGSTTIVWTVTDNCGNIGTCSQTITVEDVSAPNFLCPNDMVVYADDCETTLFWDKPILDNCNFNGFVGDFAPANWGAPVHQGTSGATNGAFSALTGGATLTAPSDGTAGVQDYVEVCIVAPQSGLITFDWSAIMTNGVDTNGGQLTNNETSYLLNGVETMLAQGTTNSAEGSLSYFSVNGGDVICLRAYTTNDLYYTLFSITNFEYFPGASLVLTSPVVPDSFEGAGDGELVGPGTYTILCEVSDGFGNKDWCTFDIVVLDPEPVNITCYQDITLNILDPNSCDTTAYFLPATVTDNCPLVGAPIQSSGPISDSAPGAGDGTPLSPGTYAVEYEYFDGVDRYTCYTNITVTAYEDMALACKNINVSLDENCEIEITPEMVLAGDEIELGCLLNYEITISDPHGELPTNILTDSLLGYDLTYMICVAGGGNCCWGNLVLEDKFPPKIICPDAPIVTTCNGLDLVEIPVGDDNCSYSEVIVVDEVFDNYECDPNYVGRVFRTYIAIDGNGAQSLPCTVEILLSRVSLNDIHYPHDLTKPNNKALHCDGSDWLPDENGHPDPWYGPGLNGPMSGSGSGVPTTNGVPIYPNVPEIYCNSYVDYEDQVFQHGCATKIQRTWTIREWHCSGEFVTSGVQLIEIVDHKGPQLTPIDTVFSTTSWNCVGQVYLPAIEATDICGAEFTYQIEYPDGVMDTNGGLVEIPVGEHEVKYTVYDECYNSSYQYVTVVVKDHTAPVTVCEINTVVSVPHSGNVEVWAQTFDDGSWDDCYIHDYLVRRMDTTCDEDDLEFDDSVSFCCEDVGKEVMVVLRVVDGGGYWNECMVVVHVQDKISPDLTCPEDVTIYCDDSYDLDNANFFFGEPTISDNCSTPDNIEQVFEDNITQCNTGTIVRTFNIRDEQQNVISTCSQIITVLARDPFGGDDIIWPEDYTGNGCGANDLQPEDLPEENAFPTFIEDECDLVGFNFEDEIFEFVPGEDACIKILRHWRLIDWCEVIDTEFTTYSHTQVIKVHNQLGPEIMGNCDTVFVESNDPDCLGGLIDINMSASDDCTNNLEWNFEFDYFNDGVIDSVGVGAIVTGNYPVGEHEIHWEVLDKCGNVDYCSQIVNIISNKAPSPVCINGLSVDLVPMDLDSDGDIDNEMALLWASDFDASSAHPCNNDFVLSFSQDTTDIYLELDCDDIGIVMVELWATDVITGANAYCGTFVDVQDNNGLDFCTGENNNRANVSGTITTESGEAISNVTLELIGAGINPLITGNGGLYAFPDMPLGGSYALNPSKNDDYLNGISTLDLVMIQRHILGSAELDSPYKMIAADINKNAEISAIDLIHLRKLILGVYNEFPDNDSWRFISSDYEFIDDANPLLDVLPEDYNISSLDSDMLVDFIGIKVGDVNNSIDLGINNSNTSARNARMEFTYEIIADAGKSVIPVYATNGGEFSGLQMSLNTMLGTSKFRGVKSGQLIVKFEDYHITNTGQLNISIALPKDKTLNATDPIFYIEATEEVQGILLNEGAQTSPEAYTSNYETIDVSLSSLDSPEVLIGALKPNPWSANMKLDIELGEAQMVDVTIYDLTGKVRYTKNESMSKGTNTLNFSHDDVDGYGTFILKLSGKNWSKALRMIHLR